MPQYQFPVTGPVKAAVRVPSGAIEVVAEERADAEVDVQPADGSTESQELAEEVRVEMRGGDLSVVQPDTSGWRRRTGTVAVTVRVPLDSSLHVKTASAGLDCRGRLADVDVENASGAVAAEHCTGHLTVRTASGDLRVTRVDGHLRLKGASGRLTAGRVAGSVGVKLASGGVEIDDVGGDVDVKTASGDVRVGRAASGTVRVGTVSGDVDLGVTAGTGVWLDVSTVSGRTRNGLEMGAGTADANGHQLTLQLRTVSGDIDIHRAS